MPGVTNIFTASDDMNLTSDIHVLRPLVQTPSADCRWRRQGPKVPCRGQHNVTKIHRKR